MRQSCVLLVPSARMAEMNALAVQMEWMQAGGDFCTVPMSASGNAPATHYAARTDIGAETQAMIAASENEYADFMAAIVYDIRPSLIGHFNDVATANGLKKIEVAEEE